MSWFVEMDPVSSSHVTGRLRTTDQEGGAAPTLELWIDGAFETAHSPARGEPRPVEFRLSLPGICFDGQEHGIALRCNGVEHAQVFQSRYDGFVDPFSTNVLTGWILDTSRVNTPVEVEIDLNGRCIGRVTADHFRGHLAEWKGWRGYNGMEFAMPELPERRRSFTLRVRVADTDIDLQGSPVLSLARPRTVRAVQQVNQAFHYLEQRLLWEHGRGPAPELTPEERLHFADLLLQGSDVADILELRRRFLLPMQPRLTEHYARRDHTALGSHYPQSQPRRARGAHRDRPVDVIVPVYAGYEETARCLASLLTSSVGCRYELICVLDNPSARELRALLEQTAREHAHVTAIVNDKSTGFADSVNSAMALHRDRDICILQADCEVHGDWLWRLRRAAYEGAGAGLVNPLANSSEFLSYPWSGLDLPPDAPLAVLDNLAKRVNRHQTVPLPAAMAHCLYVRRGCLDDLGFFHNDQPSGGYYAEKYFSVNAAALGWRSVLATDVFVKHIGFVSFAERSAARIETARDDFDRWCPFYADSVTDFLVDDPALPAKRELDLGRLDGARRPGICLVTHNEGGGTERHVRDLDSALQWEGVPVFTMYSLPDGRVLIQTFELEFIDNLVYRVKDEWERLIGDLRRLNIRHFHFHSNPIGASHLLALPHALGATYDVTIHDYGWFCPRVNLVNRSGAYCGEPPAHVCTTCSGTDVPVLTNLSQERLSGARRIFCPSGDVLQRMERHFQLSGMCVRPHPEQISPPLNRRARVGEQVTVAVIGRLSGHKGLRVVRQCAAHALEWNLPLRFTIVGSTSGECELAGLTNLEITGEYQEEEVDDLLADCDARVALLPSIWPETYSYTLSIALRNGLIPVAFDMGAIAERIRRAGIGMLLPPEAGAEQVNAALLHAASRAAAQAAKQAYGRLRHLGTAYPHMLRDYYGLTDDLTPLTSSSVKA